MFVIVVEYTHLLMVNHGRHVPNQLVALIMGAGYGNNLFVIGCYDGKVATSTDGTTWTKVDVVNDNNMML